jgi:hypothetical protein
MSSRRSSLLLIILMSGALFAANRVGATDYYVHPVLGDDKNLGTSPQAALRTLARASRLNLSAGDRLLLAAGQKFEGQLAFENVTGTDAQPIVISSYADKIQSGSEPAEIDAKGFVAGVCLNNCSFITVADLRITADGGGMRPGQMVKPDKRCGVLVVASQPGEFAGFVLTNLTVQDVFFESSGFVRSPADTKTANGDQSYGWGIWFLNLVTNSVIRNITIADCRIENVSHTGLKFTAPRDGVVNLDVRRVKVFHTGGPGAQMSGVCGGRFSYLDVNGSGSTNDTRNWKRGSGLWTWGCRDVVIENSRFQNAAGPGDSCGVHIDFNCRDVIVQKNFSANNAGGFCEILGNNRNCAYRYNISVNDGYRTKGVKGAIQEGKTFWLSGYVGNKKEPQGPFNTYFYNNTIYVGKNLDAKISVAPTTQGLLIANNIFYFQGRSKIVKGDQTRSDSAAAGLAGDVVFKNNLYLRRDNWPNNLPLQDQQPLIGDPGFQNGGGMSLMDYVRTNTQLVGHRGIPIPKLPHDQIGLLGGLELETDILGQKISGKPGLGAIETTAQAKHNSGSL